MLILIEKDSQTRLPREVADLDEAVALSATYPIHIPMEDGTSKPLQEYLNETSISVGGNEDDADKQAAAEKAAFEKSGLTESQWKKLAKAKRAELIAAEVQA